MEERTMALSDVDREHLERRLKEERLRVIQILDRSVADQSAGSEQDRTGDLTKVPFHPADLGSDGMEAELATSNAARLSNELTAIDEALERLYRTPEQFGICQDTGVEIPLARLEVIPWARTCDEAGA
jgi:RNA polymerase-binding transcription factor DksA